MKLETIMKKMKYHTPAILGQQDLVNYSILLPLIEISGELHLLFEVRSHKMRRQPGEVCFPGGKKDEQDQRDQDTATRESMEELGIDAHNINQVIPLGYMISPFGMRVNGYIGFLSCALNDISPNPDEVGEVFTVPLDFFLETKPNVHYVNLEVKPESDFPFDLIPNGRDYEWRPRQMEEYFYRYEDKVIWGLTARVLYHFIEVMKK